MDLSNVILGFEKTVIDYSGAEIIFSPCRYYSHDMSGGESLRRFIYIKEIRSRHYIRVSVIVPLQRDGGYNVINTSVDLEWLHDNITNAVRDDGEGDCIPEIAQRRDERYREWVYRIRNVASLTGAMYRPLGELRSLS